MAAFFLLCSGKADFEIKDRPGMAERLFIIGSVERPIMVCQRKEIPGLFTQEFWQYYEVWSYFHFGFGLPGGRPWDEQDPGLMKTLLTMEQCFRRDFTTGAASLKYMESIIKHQRAQMGMKN